MRCAFLIYLECKNLDGMKVVYLFKTNIHNNWCMMRHKITKSSSRPNLTTKYCSWEDSEKIAQSNTL